MALILLERSGGVGSHNLLAVDLGHDGDVLANRQPERVVGMGEGESVADKLSVWVKRV